MLELRSPSSTAAHFAVGFLSIQAFMCFWYSCLYVWNYFRREVWTFVPSKTSLSFPTPPPFFCWQFNVSPTVLLSCYMPAGLLQTCLLGFVIYCSLCALGWMYSKSSFFLGNFINPLMLSGLFYLVFGWVHFQFKECLVSFHYYHVLNKFLYEMQTV